MLKASWKAGSVPDLEGPLLVSATRFQFSRLRDMPGILNLGMGLRRGWPLLQGAVGLSVSADLLGRTTYTVSAWRSEADFRAFLTSPGHLRLMREYRSRVVDSAAVSWQVERFDLGTAWREAPRRLAGVARRSG